MSFQEIKPVEKADFYLDVAFRRAKELAVVYRPKIKIETMLQKSRDMELYKIEIVKNNLVSHLNKIIKNFPSIKDLDSFYLELVKCTIDIDYLRQSLGALDWAKKKIYDFHKIYNNKIRNSTDIKTINRHRREFYGRISSVLKQISKNLSYLEESRKIMKEYPVIKTSLKTIVITGFPNVGKTTLLYKLTGSKPDIQNYPFTTKGINIAYLKRNDERIQLLDTPGTLNRFERMNNLEKQAYLAIKFLASSIIYVFDLSESYALEQQIALYNNLKGFNKEIIVFLSKIDLTKDKELVQRFVREYSAIIDTEELKEKLKNIFLLQDG